MARFGLTVSAVLGGREAAIASRQVDVLEVWSGCFAVGLAAVAKGYVAVPFDKFRELGKTDIDGELCEDLLCHSGFTRVLSAVLQVKRGGFLLMAPTCSSFGFPNSSRCKRTVDNPWGDTDYNKVQKGNAEAEVCNFLIALGVARGLFVVVENPPGSWLWAILSETLELYEVSEVTVPRCAYSDEPPGCKFFKPYKFLAISSDSDTAQKIQHLQGKCSCPQEVHNGRTTRKHIPLMLRNSSGGQCGRFGRLAAAAAYPRRLGEALVLAWLGQPLPAPQKKVAEQESDGDASGELGGVVPSSEASDGNDEHSDVGSESHDVMGHIEPSSEASSNAPGYEPPTEMSEDSL